MSWPRRKERLAALLAGGVLAMTAACSVSTQDSAPGRADPGAARPTAKSTSRPTIVFVHGAWADASGFDEELADLSRQGFPVTAVANPLRGLSSDAAYLRSRLQSIPGPVVVVGHSYGGAVMGAAATGLPNVKALVYLAGWGLNEGESVMTLSASIPGSHIDPSTFDAVPISDPAAPGGRAVDTYIKNERFADIFAGDVPAQRSELQAITQRPMTDWASTEKAGVPAWRTVPSWYLVTTDDHAIAPDAQKLMATRMRAHVTEVASAHDVMISHPAESENVILEAAASVPG